MTARQPLPDRRSHLSQWFEHDGIEYSLGVGHFDDGTVAELFLGYGTAADAAARDTSIAASLALQFGFHLEMLRRAVTRDLDGHPSGALGAALDILTRDAETDGQ
jgi:hypothetical protein